MIEVKEAVLAAKRFFVDVSGKGAAASLTLEEVEWSRDGHWLITLGIPDLLPGIGATRYKIFKVDGKTGQVMSMKIRPVK